MDRSKEHCNAKVNVVEVLICITKPDISSNSNDLFHDTFLLPSVSLSIMIYAGIDILYPQPQKFAWV